MMNPRILRRSILASAISLACSAHAIGSDVTLAAGTTDNVSASVGGTDHVAVGAGAIWSVDDTVIKWKDPSTGLVIDNAGLIVSTANGGRAINASGDGSGARYLVLNNGVGATIQSQDDAFRINTDFSEGKVVINNAGTIHSTVDGQAIDFDVVSSTGTARASITVNNLAGGLIRADGADAIRPGEGGTINNAGTIYSNGVLGDSNDGIDFQEHAGTVVNLAGGLISGQRHGITSSVDVSVNNASGGAIIGRNGSGVGSDGTGRVVNYGTITGAYVGTGDGDGDGVDIDNYGEVENGGVIEGTGAGGVDKGGSLNISEGVTITGGGVVNNLASGIIRGVTSGITGYGAKTVNGDGSTSYGKFTVINAGDIYGGQDGASFLGDIAVLNTGSIRSGNAALFFNSGSTGYVENAGTISGTNYAIRFADGNDTLVIDPGSVIVGMVDGGAGHNALWLRGGNFETAQDFQYLYVSGAATLTGDNGFENVLIDGNLQLGNGGTTGSVGSASIVDDGSLAVNRSDSVTIANTISGTGGVRQIGAGTTLLTGQNTYAGTTSAEAGTLVIGDAGMGSVAGDAVVMNGATLRGTGKIGGDLNVFAGGVLNPGSPAGPGMLFVAGNVAFQRGAIYAVDIVGEGLAVGGRISIGDGSILLVQAADALKPGTAYPLLSAAGGIEGRFEETRVLNADYLFLVPVLSYTATGAALSLERNEVALNTIARTPVERSTADAVDALGIASPVASSVFTMDATSARSAIDALSGQQYASTRASLLDSAHYVRDAVTRHLLGIETSGGEGRSAESDGFTTWSSAWGHDGDNSRGDASRVSAQGGGLVVGADMQFGDSRLGTVVGRGRDEYDVNAQYSSSRVWSTYLGFYGDTAWDAWHMRGGITYAWQNVDTSRHLVALGDVAPRLSSHYDANIAQAFAEAGYRFDIGEHQWLEPFAGLVRVRLHTDEASEGSAPGSLDVASGNTSIDTASVGVRHTMALGASGRTQAHVSLAWNRSWGDINAAVTQRFAGTSFDFPVTGTPVARSAAAMDAGLTFALSPRTTLEASYTGQFARQQKDQGGRLELAFRL
jgi:autotransporter-associated beta strand protein